MSPREWKFRVIDIIESIQAIQNYTDDITFDEFCRDQKTADAVVLAFRVGRVTSA